MRIAGSNKRPEYCQFNDPDLVHDQYGRCQHIEHVPDDRLEGSSGFCLGKISGHSFEIEGMVHDNDFILCINAPNIKEKEFWTYQILINRIDMEILHMLAVRALAERSHMPKNVEENK